MNVLNFKQVLQLNNAILKSLMNSIHGNNQVQILFVPGDTSLGCTVVLLNIDMLFPKVASILGYSGRHSRNIVLIEALVQRSPVLKAYPRSTMGINDLIPWLSSALSAAMAIKSL